MQIHIFIYTYVYIYICIYAYICIFTYICIHLIQGPHLAPMAGQLVLHVRNIWPLRPAAENTSGRVLIYLIMYR